MVLIFVGITSGTPNGTNAKSPTKFNTAEPQSPVIDAEQMKKKNWVRMELNKTVDINNVTQICKL